ncbi:hypothetical protein KMI_02g02880 [Encephalitozoon hellem]|uniref:Uncharacterized protein n=1 Tax=Encephalitozoon hellem TaxID=27973 RepID=A0ABY8CL07_ENCHE|nr:hypothetical protein KMI_02g02880 [Encephalitozoon hellem]WEL39603.1 hypothetical protein PFJ87_10g00500 [Encephalitozoon hellem]
MAGPERLRLLDTLADEIISKTNIRCTKGAKEILSMAAAVSASFLSACTDKFTDEGADGEAVIKKVLMSLGIPINFDGHLCC